MKRRPNPKLAKINRSYTVDEVATLYSVHRNTVRQWIKRGLSVCDDKRPLLIIGSELRTFLEAKRARNKRTCKPGEIYCVRCRVPQSPALGMADYKPISETLGSLVGLCPCCDLIMYRRVSLAKLALAKGNLAITLPQAPERLGDSTSPIVNSDFKEVAPNHAKA